MTSGIKLISTDFDGTLIGHPSDGRCIEAFGRVLMDHRKDGGLWVINTGRSYEHTLEGIRHFQAPIQPDFLVCLEREIYVHDGGGKWNSHEEWNLTCQRRHDFLFEEVKPLLGSVVDYINASSDVTLISEEGHPVGLVTTSEEVMEHVVEVIEHHAREYPDFSYQRNTIYLRFCHRAYHKGSALEEIARLANIPATSIFAAGDNYNDLAMLDGKYAHMPACPHNAIPEVKNIVESAAGYVARTKYAEGIAEAYQWFSKNGDRFPNGR